VGTFSAASLIGLPVRLHAIKLATPVDLLVDTVSWRALGFVVESRDGATRFLPFAASEPGTHEIAVHSALMLLDDAAFYTARGIGLRTILGEEIRRHGVAAGVLLDLVVDRAGRVCELELEQDGAVVAIAAAGAVIAGSRVTRSRVTAA
jgi:hypothetical protein